MSSAYFPEAAEAERGRINDLITAGLDPRLYGIAVEAVPLSGGAVLAVHIPRSPSRPHRVTSGGSNRFWLRNSTGAYEANVADLKNLFLQSAEITERAAEFHRERTARIRSTEIVANLSEEPSSIILHIIHGDAFSGASIVDPKRAYELERHFQPMGNGLGRTPQFAFDGFLSMRGGDKCSGYTLVRRNGTVECVKLGLANRRDILPVFPIEAMAVNSTVEFIRGLSELGVVPPFFALVTLEATDGRKIAYGTADLDDNSPIQRKTLQLPIVSIETWENAASVGDAFRPAFDAMWNAGGHAGSLSYKSGHWEQIAGR